MKTITKQQILENLEEMMTDMFGEGGAEEIREFYNFEEIPQFKGTLEQLNTLTILKKK